MVGMDRMADTVLLLKQLDWHIGHGLNDPIHDEAFAYLTAKATPIDNAVKHDKPPSIKPASKPSLGSHQAIQKAELLAAQAKDFATLKSHILEFQDCDLVDTAANAFIGEGNIQNPKLMMILPTPDYDEDRFGQIHKGPRGQFLKSLLKASKIDEADCMSAFAVFGDHRGSEALP